MLENSLDLFLLLLVQLLSQEDLQSLQTIKKKLKPGVSHGSLQHGSCAGLWAPSSPGCGVTSPGWPWVCGCWPAQLSHSQMHTKLLGFAAASSAAPGGIFVHSSLALSCLPLEHSVPLDLQLAGKSCARNPLGKARSPLEAQA